MRGEGFSDTTLDEDVEFTAACFRSQLDHFDPEMVAPQPEQRSLTEQGIDAYQRLGGMAYRGTVFAVSVGFVMLGIDLDR